MLVKYQPHEVIVKGMKPFRPIIELFELIITNSRSSRSVRLKVPLEFFFREASSCIFPLLDRG